MKEEIEVAVSWWRGIIDVKYKHDHGEVFSSALANYVNSMQPEITKEQKDEFAKVLTCLLPDYLKKSGWEKAINEKQPELGSYNRALSVDYEADGILRAAAQTAGIRYTSTLFPHKTTMWINPGEVKVSCGYGAQIKILYEKEESKEIKNEKSKI